ncbi:MAG: serine hydrolase [Sphingomonadaceae bacterium]|nr:serine hydrolase [Sphingomonadaceae bacterium]
MWRSMIVGAMLALAGCASVPPPAAEAPAVWSWTRVEFNREAITGAAAEGLADPATGRRLTPDDPVRIASISKLIVALGVLRLVERGTLDLERDVSLYLGWRLRNPEHPDVVITLRRLLSHTSGLRDGDDIYVIPLGGSVRATLANPEVWDARERGFYFAYSNLNFPVIASVVERATGERFDRVMAREVFAPLGLDACFNWTTCSDARLARAVVLRDEHGAVVRDDLRGARPPCAVVPDANGGCELSGYALGDNGALFSPQGGARVSVEDLAAIGRVLLNRGVHEGRRFLSPQTVAYMTTPVWADDGSNGDSSNGYYCAYGLAVQIIGVGGCPDPFGDGRVRVGHTGDAYGVVSGLWVDPEAGTGVAYFATGVSDNDRPRGRTPFLAVEEAMMAGSLLEIRR